MKKGRAGGCWVWTGTLNAAGYGLLRIHGRGLKHAHRLSWELHGRTIPAGLFICHTCDNPPCVNPAHLFLGTASDNIRDMLAKGRQVVVSRLDWAHAQTLLSGGWGQRRIAREIGVSHTAVHKAIKRGALRKPA